MNEQELVYACTHEKHAKNKERMLLVKFVEFDGDSPAQAANKLGHPRAWGNRWMRRYREEGIDGLKTKKHTGRPPKMTPEEQDAIKEEIREAQYGYTTKQVASLIHEKMGVKYHMNHIRFLLHAWKFSQKVPRKRFGNTASEEEKKKFQKRVVQMMPKKKKEGHVPMIEDESISVADTVYGKKTWQEVGTRPTINTFGSHAKTVIFGVLTDDGRQCFKQYDRFDAKSFVEFLNHCCRRYGEKILMYMDRAPQHNAKIVQEWLDNHPDFILEFLPKGSPELSAIEEVWKQQKYETVRSEYQPSLADLKDRIALYLRTHRFNLDIKKYLMRDITA